MSVPDFVNNVTAHSAEDLRPYLGRHVAWSVDGRQVLAHGANWEELLREVDRLGLTEYVTDFIPDPAIRYHEGEVP